LPPGSRQISLPGRSTQDERGAAAGVIHVNPNVVFCPQRHTSTLDAFHAAVDAARTGRSRSPLALSSSQPRSRCARWPNSSRATPGLPGTVEIAMRALRGDSAASDELDSAARRAAAGTSPRA
jgi:hypothetical protein